MQFQVPQFIDNDDKIIGGVLTMRQFLIVCGGGFLCFLLFFLLQSLVAWLFASTIVISFTLGISLIKKDCRPITTIFIRALKYYWNPQLYLFKSDYDFELEIKTNPSTNSSKKISSFNFSNPLSFFKNIIPKKNSTNDENSEPATPETTKNDSIIQKYLESTIKLSNTNKNIPTKVKPKKEEQITSKIELKSQIDYDTTIKKPDINVQIVKPIEAPKKEEISQINEPIQEIYKAPTINITPREIPKKHFEHIKKEEPIDLNIESPNIFDLINKTENNKNINEESSLTNTRLEASLNSFQFVTSIREKLAHATNFKNINEKINTWKTALPNREKKFTLTYPWQKKEPKIEIVRRATGELERAKRIDY